MSKKIVIVIAGVTCGGKTTLANSLKNKFNNISILHQDDFYYDEYELNNSEEFIHSLNYSAWDQIKAFDMNKMINSINSQTSKILVLEGILLLDDPRILKLADLMFFIINDKACTWERRKVKSYLPPEPDRYFDEYAWPEYEKHLAKIKKEKYDVHFLNGSDSIDFNIAIVVKHINNQLSNLK